MIFCGVFHQPGTGFCTCDFQVITKLLYLINQGETFTKVSIREGFLKWFIFWPSTAILSFYRSWDKLAPLWGWFSAQCSYAWQLGFFFFIRWRPQRFSFLSPSCSSPRTLAYGAWFIWWSKKSHHQAMRYSLMANGTSSMHCFLLQLAVV